MTLIGEVEDIIFRNEENGYTVAVVSRGKEKTVVVGKFLSVKAGQSVRLEGNFVMNKKYGEQFSVESAEIVEPTTAEGIEKYLSSGLIPGVGPVTAKSMVEKFGDQTLEVIEFSPEKLSKVRGISNHKAEVIAENFTNLKKMQRSLMFLQKYEISINMALKIYAAYGDKTVDLMQENPYKLVEDVDGIGFLTADRIAYSMGIEKESIFRVRAAVLHCLNEGCEKSGNTFLPAHDLLSQVAKLLGYSTDEISEKFENVIDTLIFDKLIIKIYNDKIQGYELQKYYNTELGIAKKLAMLSTCQNKDEFDLQDEISLFETFNNIKFHDEQKRAIEMSVKNPVSIITGGPGTGKTTIIKCVMSTLKQMGKTIALVAPTGRAAKRLSESTGVEAKTIHRLLELEFVGRKVNFKYNEHEPLPYGVVIVDEVSMVDCLLMHSLLKALPRDCKLILVGDKDQLPSVGAGNVLKDILQSETVPTTYLTKIFRQDENSLIVSNAHLINAGEMPELDNSKDDFFFESKTDTEDIKNSIITLVTERLPIHFNIDTTKIQVIAPLKAGICGTINLNRELQDKLNPPSLGKHEITIGQTTLRRGDKIMQTVNNYDIEWTRKNGVLQETGLGVFNGDIGYIHDIDRDTSEAIIWFEDGREAVYTRVELQDITLSYAITVHKSQGCEFDVVVMPMIAGSQMILTRNLFYTAVTRAKRAVVLVGEKKNMRRMIASTHTAKRNTMLKNLIIKEFKKAEEIYG